jgi:hypothetical protein
MSFPNEIYQKDPPNLCQICQTIAIPIHSEKGEKEMEKVRYSCGTLRRVQQAAENGCEFCSLADMAIHDAIKWWMLGYSEDKQVVLEIQPHESSETTSIVGLPGGINPAARPRFSFVTRGRKRDYRGEVIGSEILLSLTPDSKIGMLRI